MASFNRQNSGAFYHTTSIARNNDGIPFSAQARAHELHAFRSNQDRNQVFHDTPSNNLDGNDEPHDNMAPRRQRWRKLDIHDLDDESPSVAANESRTNSPSNTSGQLDPSSQSTLLPLPLRRRRSESKVALLVNATQKRRARTGDFESLDPSPTDAEFVRRPSPFPSERGQQNYLALHQEYGAHVHSPIVNLPIALKASKPPAFYPAVKGTSTDQQRQDQSGDIMAHLRNNRHNIPTLQLTRATNSNPHNSNSNQLSWSQGSNDAFTPDGFTPDEMSQPARRHVRMPADPFEGRLSPSATFSTGSQEEESRFLTRRAPQQNTVLASHGNFATDNTELPSFVRLTVSEDAAMKKGCLLEHRYDRSTYEEDRRFNTETRQAIQQALRGSSRVRSISAARTSRIGAVGDRRPVFGGYVFSDSIDGSFEKAEQEESDDVFHRLILPVMATLKSYSKGEKDYFNPFVPAADWTVDHSPAGRQSYFGEDWGTPPARVGRDPRYRGMHHELRHRDDIGVSAGAGFQHQTPVRMNATARFRAFQEYSGSSGSSQYSGVRVYRNDEEQPLRWNANGADYIRRGR